MTNIHRNLVTKNILPGKKQAGRVIGPVNYAGRLTPGPSCLRITNIVFFRGIGAGLDGGYFFLR